MKALIHKEKRYVCFVGTLVSCWDYQRFLKDLYSVPLNSFEVVDISDKDAEEFDSPKREGKLYFYRG